MGVLIMSASPLPDPRPPRARADAHSSISQPAYSLVSQMFKTIATMNTGQIVKENIAFHGCESLTLRQKITVTAT